ncbi:MAG TPA: VOC family protein [Burkholderiales bacterium]|nr:VOC family protein [Burkholderiales bacterium]
MSRIVHLALKVDDLERTTQFYREVFGFAQTSTDRVRDLALIKYDAGTQSAESRAAGDGPCIHHFAVEVPDLRAAERRIRALGCEIISDAGVIPVKFRAPGGTVCELVPEGRYRKPRLRAKESPARKKPPMKRKKQPRR